MSMTKAKDYSIGEDAFNFFFGLLGVFNHYEFFTKKLWRKIDGFKNRDEAEVKCAFMSYWTYNTLGIPTYPLGGSWSIYCGSKELFDEYVKEWAPVFKAYREWCYDNR